MVCYVTAWNRQRHPPYPQTGEYLNPDGAVVSIRDALDAAVQGTMTYTPQVLDGLLDRPSPGGSRELQLEVTGERTQIAARRLVVEEGVGDLLLLNYASARNVGGGFLKGARAQEEDLMRCSGLYAAVRGQDEYYAANRAVDSMLYTDHLIYSPGVPFFRAKNRDRLKTPYTSAVITAPAPNAGQARRRDPDSDLAIEAALRRRAGKILAVAAERGHTTLLLGAWGCGVFMNDPAVVADAFGTWLRSERFSGVFQRAIFAVFEPKGTSKQETFARILDAEGKIYAPIPAPPGAEKRQRSSTNAHPSLRGPVVGGSAHQTGSGGRRCSTPGLYGPARRELQR
ncbi:MAG: TIGR02452 family protein [Myxococcota bacterium]